MHLSLKRLTEEHERLQHEYAKLRQQCLDPDHLKRADSTKISDLEKMLQKAEDETLEVKENLEFISSERDVLQDAIRELEELLTQEKQSRQNEKESLEKLASHSKVLYDKVCSKK
jgi:chromosome segregation ATPase